MSYSEDAVNAKLSALNETQESIVTTAQWVMFHRRYAERTIKLWHDKLGTSTPAKRLNLIYLINEVAQQSKFRKREEFRAALAAVIADGVFVAYNGATNDIKTKIKRVIDVWKDREIFEENVRDDIDRRVDAVDRKRGEIKRPLMGSGSAGAATSTSSVPEELQDLAKFYLRTHKASESVKSTRDAIDGWEESMNSFTIESTTPRSAAKINALHNRLAQAHAAAVESVLSRQAIIDELEKLLKFNKTVRTEHQLLAENYNDKKEATFEKKTEIENTLLAKMHFEGPWAPLDKPSDLGELNNGYHEPERPQVEALTPPPMATEEDDYNPPEAGDNTNGPGTPPAMFGFDDAADDDTDPDDGNPAKRRRLGDGFGSFMGRGTVEQDVDELIRSEGGS